MLFSVTTPEVQRKSRTTHSGQQKNKLEQVAFVSLLRSELG